MNRVIRDHTAARRAKFYTHFDNKEDLLISGLDQLQETLKQRQREMLQTPQRRIWRSKAF